MAALLTELAHTSGWSLDELFIAGVILAIAAQIIAYRSGGRTTVRWWGMWCGIGSTVLLFLAGQIAGARLWDYANSIAGHSLGL